MKTNSIKTITRKIDSITGILFTNNCHTVQIQLENGQLSPIYVIGDGVVSGAHARLDGMTLDYMVLNGYILPLVLCLLSLMGISDERISLCMGLPNGLIPDVSRRSSIEGQMTHFLIGPHTYIFDGQKKKLLINDISFTVQGFAALCSKLLDTQGEFAALSTEKLDAPMTVLDIGYSSSDLLNINNKEHKNENEFVVWKKLPGIKDLCCSIQDGMSRIFGKTYFTPEDLLPSLLGEKDIELENPYSYESDKYSGSWIKRLFKSKVTPTSSGVLPAKNGGVDIAGFAKKRWATETAKIMESYNTKTSGLIYITGGGAIFLHDEIRDLFPEGEFLPDPIYAAALGCNHLGAARHQTNVVGIDLGSYCVKGALDA